MPVIYLSILLIYLFLYYLKSEFYALIIIDFQLLALFYAIHAISQAHTHVFCTKYCLNNVRIKITNSLILNILSS